MIPSATGTGTDPTWTRIVAQRLRLRVERVATETFEQVTGRDCKHRYVEIEKRLLFLLLPTSYDLYRARAIVRGARRVYGETSDLLHGRTTALQLPSSRLSEWSAAVDELDDLARAVQAALTPISP